MLELLLAMALASMLAMSLHVSMSVAMSSRRSATATVESIQGAMIASEMVRHDLESILAPTGVLAGPFYGVHEQNGEKDADRLEFCTIGSDRGPVDELLTEGIRRVELSLRTDAEPPVLVRRVTRNLLATLVEDPIEEIICRNVQTFSVRYFDGDFWTDEWDSTLMGDVLPMAIEVTIEARRSDQPADAKPARVVRIITLPCATPPDETQAEVVP